MQQLNNISPINSSDNVYLGVMSGTSLDAVDVVAVSFEPEFTIHETHSVDMPKDIKQNILRLCSSGDHEIELLGALDIQLGELFADCCNQVIARLKHKKITAIGLHGQTIRHRPENTPLSNFTLQIGDANTVAELTGLTTVADFRRRDMAAGGQGAPLVPAFHKDLFQCIDHKRVIINIGGMANISLLSTANSSDHLIGFDTGPGNVLLDAWIQQAQGKSYDDHGQWAERGNINDSLLAQLLKLPYFDQSYPKSTGREQFNLQWLQNSIDACPDQLIPPEDIQCTLLELTVTTLSNDIHRHRFADAEIYVCGGGAYNRFLMQRLSALLPQARCVTTTEKLGLAPSWVEAAAFAWLAKQTLNRLYGNCPSVTGAKGERILGAIYQA